MLANDNRDGQITADDHGPVVDIVAWFLMVTMILAVTVRLITRTTLTHSPGAEDGIICGSLVRQSTLRLETLHLHSWTTD